MTGKVLTTKQYVINYSLKSMIDEFVRSTPDATRGFNLCRGRPQRDDWKHLPRLKIVISLLGPTNAGKSCLARNIDFAQPVVNRRQAITVATDISFFHSDLLFEDQYVVTIQLNDCPGNERYESLSNHHFRNCHGAIFVADTTDFNVFDRLDEYWYKTLLVKTLFEDVETVLACNKIDLLEQPTFDDDYREKFFHRAHDFAARYQIPVFNISAARGDNISEMFHQLISNILQNPTLVQHLKDAAETKCPSKMPATIEISRRPSTVSMRRKRTKACCSSS